MHNWSTVGTNAKSVQAISSVSCRPCISGQGQPAASFCFPMPLSGSWPVLLRASEKEKHVKQVIIFGLSSRCSWSPATSRCTIILSTPPGPTAQKYNSTWNRSESLTKARFVGSNLTEFPCSYGLTFLPRLGERERNKKKQTVWHFHPYLLLRAISVYWLHFPLLPLPLPNVLSFYFIFGPFRAHRSPIQSSHSRILSISSRNMKTGSIAGQPFGQFAFYPITRLFALQDLTACSWLPSALPASPQWSLGLFFGHSESEGRLLLPVGGIFGTSSFF